MAVTVRLPAVLAEMVGGERRFEVDGATIGEALDDLVRQRPGLSVHFFDDAGAVRRHILCFHNDAYLIGRESLEQPLCAGDVITILNSVAGG